MKILESFTAAADFDSDLIRSITFTDVVVSPSGRIHVSFRGGPAKGPNTGESGYTCHSDDGGKTFTYPRAPFGDLPMRDGKTGHLRGMQLLPLGGKRLFGVCSVVENMDDELPYFNEETEAIKNTQLYCFFSEDDGETFSEPREILMTAQYRDMACVLTGPAQLLKNGDIMVNFEVYKTYWDTRSIDHTPACILSHDGGMTWDTEVTMFRSSEIYAWDHRAGEAEPGRLLDYVWTFDRRTNNYLNITMMESVDGGRTWSGLRDTGLQGQAGNPVRLPDGRIALVWFDRTGVPTCKLALSEDGGFSFGPAFTVYEHKAPVAERTKGAYAEAWDEMGKYTAGHCFQTLMPDGTLLVVLYAGPVKDKTAARLFRIAVD